MEAYEHVCKVALEAEGFVVTNNLKFSVRRKTRKTRHTEFQEHGYEIDLIAARADQLVLAEVKSYFGSAGVNVQGFKGLADPTKKSQFDRYKLFNDAELRQQICAKACEQFGYSAKQLRLRMYVGKFARDQEQKVRAHLKKMKPSVQVVGLEEVVATLMRLAGRSTYTDDPVVMTVKALSHAGKLLT
jgi:hypothetical protein